MAEAVVAAMMFLGTEVSKKNAIAEETIMIAGDLITLALESGPTDEILVAEASVKEQEVVVEIIVEGEDLDVTTLVVEEATEEATEAAAVEIE